MISCVLSWKSFNIPSTTLLGISQNTTSLHLNSLFFLLGMSFLLFLHSKICVLDPAQVLCIFQGAFLALQIGLWYFYIILIWINYLFLLQEGMDNFQLIYGFGQCALHITGIQKINCWMNECQVHERCNSLFGWNYLDLSLMFEAFLRNVSARN